MGLSKNNILLCFIFIATFLNVVVHSQNTAFFYNSFSDPPVDLTYQGDAHVPGGTGDLRLTATNSAGEPHTNSTGRVIYSHPVLFWEPGIQASFETTIRFITRSNGDNPADGIAFFIAPVGTTIPANTEGGNLGIFPPSGIDPNIFAVEFDIYVNTKWDPNNRHIGIDVGSRNSTVTTPFEGTVGQVVTARIDYQAPTRSITVSATSGIQSFEVSHTLDLKTVLANQVNVGISASTGGQVAVHDIMIWDFTSVVGTDPPEASILQYV